jgi:hypothetical protein
VRIPVSCMAGAEIVALNSANCQPGRYIFDRLAGETGCIDLDGLRGICNRRVTDFSNASSAITLRVPWLLRNAPAPLGLVLLVRFTGAGYVAGAEAKTSGRLLPLRRLLALTRARGCNAASAFVASSSTTSRCVSAWTQSVVLVSSCEYCCHACLCRFHVCST